MKTKSTFKKLAAACMLAAGAAVLPALASGDEIVKVIGEDGKVIGSYSAGKVSYIEFAEGNIAEITPDSIVIPLSDKVKFTMIKVEGGVPYTLTNPDGSKLTEEDWGETGATKIMEDFWIGKFEVTQGVWKEVMVKTDDELPLSNVDSKYDNVTISAGSKQTAIGDSYPIANVSWDDICTGSESFLAKINARLDQLKASDPALKSVLGDRTFRLPNEWEWEYAAAGGKDYATRNYYFSGTEESTPQALEKVAVNSKAPNKATSVAKVGTKEPNALLLYDMSGNVWERCSGLGYPKHENEYGFIRKNNNKWDNLLRPYRGGGWQYTDAAYFRVTFRDYSSSTENRHVNGGFRLAL